MYRVIFYTTDLVAYFSLFINVSTCHYTVFSSVQKLFKDITSGEIN